MPAPAVELEDPACDVVEEVPVVRDRDDGALVVARGTARASSTVSASRWFVGSSRSSRSGAEQQEPAERDAPPLAARERRRRPGRRRAGAARPSRGRAARRAARRRAGRSDPAPSPARRAARRSRRPARRTAPRSSLKRSSRSRSSRTPSSTFSRTVLAGVELGLLLEQPDGRPVASSAAPETSPPCRP